MRVPASYVTSVFGERIELRCGLADVDCEMAGDTLGESGDVVVPVIAEDLVANKEVVQVGELRVRKLIEEHERSIAEPVSYDELVVERVAVGRRIHDEPQERLEGDILVIPVVEEQLVCEKQRVLVEEIRVTRHRRTETRQFTGTVRRERAVIEQSGPRERVREVGEQHDEKSDKGE